MRRDNGHSKAHIGTVEHFFDKINVAAIKLIGPLKVGDIIEIGDEESAVREKIRSMQIDREDVERAGEGDSIGIKLGHKVAAGSRVYRIR
ncbi:MAG: translation elongation factor-like protein [Candidatus Micrarchaeota archaeon]|nr:translation elongation factor-like protein [Candidatus Micrarchaeota archaeon]